MTCSAEIEEGRSARAALGVHTLPHGRVEQGRHAGQAAAADRARQLNAPSASEKPNEPGMSNEWQNANPFGIEGSAARRRAPP
jgi:hypothetical protein